MAFYIRVFRGLRLGPCVIRNTKVSESSLYTVNGHASGTTANRPYNGGVRNSEVRNIEVPLYMHLTSELV